MLAHREDLTIAESLVNAGADVNTGSSEGIFLLFGGHELTTIMHWLIDHGLNVNQKRSEDDVTFLHIAATLESSTVAENLLEKGAEIDSQNRYGETPLHFAVKWRKVHMVRYLVQHGADIHIMNNEGESPLSLAQCSNNTTILDALYDDGDTLVNFGEEPESV